MWSFLTPGIAQVSCRASDRQSFAACSGLREEMVGLQDNGKMHRVPQAGSSSP